jgi:hypothetical protein
VQTNSSELPPLAFTRSISDNLPWTAMQEELHRQSASGAAPCAAEAPSPSAQRPREVSTAQEQASEQPSPSSGGRRVTFSADTTERAPLLDSPSGMRELRDVMRTLNYTR